MLFVSVASIKQSPLPVPTFSAHNNLSQGFGLSDFLSAIITIFFLEFEIFLKKAILRGRRQNQRYGVAPYRLKTDGKGEQGSITASTRHTPCALPRRIAERAAGCQALSPYNQGATNALLIASGMVSQLSPRAALRCS